MDRTLTLKSMYSNGLLAVFGGVEPLFYILLGSR